MGRSDDRNLNFFDYLDLAKKEFSELLKKYPELALLSNREIEVFEQLLTDKTQSEIAEHLFVSASSIHFHCKNIYRKLGVSCRRQILIKYKDI